MANISEYRKIYRAILDALEATSKTRGELIDVSVAAFGLSEQELADTGTNGRKNAIRCLSGTVINEMCERGLIMRDSEGAYHKNVDKPIAIRIEKCEEEILRMLRGAPMTRADIRDNLVKILGTDKTPTVKDDNKLFTYLGQVLKALVADKVVDFDGAIYSIAPARSAEIKNREQVASLKSDFLSLLHSKGGEFFEHYFMNLLERYLIRCGKTVTESKVSGGAADGGIDGIARTIDALGFRETIMVQTKNRIDQVVETDVRGFYGAVCAAQGSRGIFATTSRFHSSALEFLENLDDCVGVDGEKIFAMATDTCYGIKRVDGTLTIDREVIY